MASTKRPAKPRQDAAAPSVSAENGNRDASGRFVPGHSLPGPGRPKGFDFRAIATARAEAEGLSLEDAIYKVCRGLLTAAENGDVAAARLVLDRLCTADDAQNGILSLIVEHALPGKSS